MPERLVLTEVALISQTKPAVQLENDVFLALGGKTGRNPETLDEYEQRVIELLGTETGKNLVIESVDSGLQTRLSLGKYGNSNVDWVGYATIFTNPSGQTVINLHYF